MPKRRKHKKSNTTTTQKPVLANLSEISNKGFIDDDESDIQRVNKEFQNVVLQFNYSNPGTLTHVHGESEYYTIQECGGFGDCFFHSIANDKAFDEHSNRMRNVGVDLQRALKITENDRENTVTYIRAECNRMLSLSLYGKHFKKYPKSSKTEQKKPDYVNHCFIKNKEFPNLINTSLQRVYTYLINHGLHSSLPERPECTSDEFAFPLLPYKFSEKKTEINDKPALGYLQGQKERRQMTDLSMIMLISLVYKTNIVVHRPTRCDQEDVEHDYTVQRLDMFELIKKISSSSEFRSINNLEVVNGSSGREYIIDIKNMAGHNYMETHVYFHNDVYMFQLGEIGSEKHFNLLKELDYEEDVLGKCIFADDENQSLDQVRNKYIVSLPLYLGYDSKKFEDVLCLDYIEKNEDCPATFKYMEFNHEIYYLIDRDAEGNEIEVKKDVYRTFEAGVRMRIVLANEGEEVVFAHEYIYYTVSNVTNNIFLHSKVKKSFRFILYTISLRITKKF